MKTLKYLSVLLSVFLISLSCFSQQTETNKESNWKIGLTFSPDVYFHPITVPTGENTGYHIGSEGFNYTHGLDLQLKIRPKLEIVTGIVASKKDYAEKFYCNTCDYYINPAVELITQRFIEIPLSVRYTIIDKRLGVHIETGVTNSFLTTDIHKIAYKGGLITKKYLLGGQVGIGFDFDINDKINLSITPTYKQSFTNIWKYTDYKLSAIGFVAGVHYRIMKSH